MTALTPAQERVLEEIAAAGGERRYNGRAFGVLTRLQALGLVEFEWIPRRGSRLLIARLPERSTS